MNFNIKMYNPARQFALGCDDCKDLMENFEQIVLKNEKIGFSIKILDDKEFVSTTKLVADSCYKGLIGRYRVELSGSFGQFFSVFLMSFVKGDEGVLVADPILRCQSRFSCEKEQVFYVEGCLPVDYWANHGDLVIKFYYSEGYEKETLVWERKLDFRVSSLALPSINESEKIYIDLWQHPCNWARAYEVHYYSEEHFEIIDRYLESMGKLGQKVCDLIISDYPWAGQRCYEVRDNFQDLFELNIVGVRKNKNGFCCDFTALDKYVRLCDKHNMAQEINLFGILGNWDAFSFGNPLKDLKDPIRISYYDEEQRCLRFVDNKNDLTQYLALVFAHIKELGLWEKTFIISDEPDNVKLFEESCHMFKVALGADDVKIKCAIHNQGFFDAYEDNITSLSLNTCELVNVRDRLDEIGKNIRVKGGKFTWYSCCFPSKLNMFLSSPLMENRIKSWFTYYMNMDGFLRWAYGIWPGKVFEDARYKSEKWAAGDMFFVYPGKDMAPIDSIRLKNFVFGLQDLLLFYMYEESFGKEVLEKKMKKILGDKNHMQYVKPREVKLDYSLEYKEYVTLRNKLVEELEGR